MDLEEAREQYRTQGYFIADDAVDPAMLEPLLEATRRVKAKTRTREVDIYTHRTPEGEPWAIRGLFAPEFNEPVFSEYLMSRPVMQYVEPLIGADLRLGGVLIFTSPDQVDWSGGWHRDFGGNERDGSYEVEMEILNRPIVSLKWHLALVDDSCLQLVPGSHRRYRTDEERDRLLKNRHADISTQEVMHLKAGQTIFWSGNAVHRGIYNTKPERLTLAGSWNKHVDDEEPEETDGRVKWMLADNVRGFLPERMRPAYDRWRALQLG